MEKRKFLTLLGLELWPLCCPACNQSQWIIWENLKIIIRNDQQATWIQRINQLFPSQSTLGHYMTDHLTSPTITYIVRSGMDVYKYSTRTQHLPRQPLMMETGANSETSDTNSTLTQLILLLTEFHWSQFSSFGGTTCRHVDMTSLSTLCKNQNDVSRGVKFGYNLWFEVTWYW
jgi:hypothetical protein